MMASESRLARTTPCTAAAMAPMAAYRTLLRNQLGDAGHQQRRLAAR
jgi:hypothetical protein